MRLHIITGNAEKARHEAYELQRAQADMDWMVLNSASPSALFNYAQKRNVIWVCEGSAPIDPTTKHHITLPTTFGSSVLARTVAGGEVRRFILNYDANGAPSWYDKDGLGYHADDLITPIVSFVAEEV